MKEIICPSVKGFKTFVEMADLCDLLSVILCFGGLQHFSNLYSFIPMDNILLFCLFFIQ